MQVYSIQRNEVEIFANLEGDPDFCEVVQSLWENGKSRPEWCFVIKDQDQVLGRVGFWGEIGVTESVRGFALFILPDREDFVQIGTTLLSEALNQIMSQGVSRIGSQVNSETANFEMYEQIYLATGFELNQEKLRYTLDQADYTPVVNKRLQFRLLKDVNEGTYIDAIKVVSRNTLDLDDRKTIEEFGEDEAAKQYFECLKDIDYNPERWKLAYTGDTLVGLVVPQTFNEQVGAINYIGVVPEYRGKGYSLDLLSAGVETLFQEGTKQIIADIDKDNFPLRENLPKIGFKLNHSLKIYCKNNR